MEFIKDLITYAIIIAVIILIKIYVFTTSEVVGSSMEPNLYNGNIMLVDKVVHKYVSKPYNRFDIIVIKYSEPSYLIKRIIGIPGDNVEYTSNELYINGNLVEEKFKTKGITEDFSLSKLNYSKIPKGMYFVVGDNRSESVDSRTIGLIKEKDIVGKPFVFIWPLDKIGLVK